MNPIFHGLAEAGTVALGLLAVTACAKAGPPPVQSCPEGMVTVPGGTFTMGKAGDAGNRGPAHEVTLSPYCLDETEVTTAAYQACVDGGGCAKTKAGRLCNLGDSAKASHPVNCVSYDQAAAYCAAASKRLPTEAEWEFAARGPKGFTYPWGNRRPNLSRAHWSTGGKLFTRTVPVKRKPKGKSPFGAHDMAGNVCELVGDWYADRYPSGAVTDPTGPSSGAYRICRGGSLNVRDADAVSATFRRYGYRPGSTDELTGFRCAVPLEKAP